MSQVKSAYEPISRQIGASLLLHLHEAASLRALSIPHPQFRRYLFKHFTPWWREAPAVEVKCLAQEHNITVRPGPIDPESSELTMGHHKPPRCIYRWVIDRVLGEDGWILAVFFAFLSTETESRSMNSQKKNKANFQLS